MKDYVFLDNLYLIWGMSVCLFFELIFFLEHTISSYQLQIFYSGLISSVAIVVFSQEPRASAWDSQTHEFGYSSSSCYQGRVKSTPSFGMSWQFDDLNVEWKTPFPYHLSHLFLLVRLGQG